MYLKNFKKIIFTDGDGPAVIRGLKSVKTADEDEIRSKTLKAIIYADRICMVG